MLLFPHINPVALQIGPLSIHWYGLAYVAALLLGLLYVKRLARAHPRPGLTPDTFESLFTWVVLGVIVGGRLGYTLFYAPAYFLAHPVEVLYVWQGGMSFHGGALGVVAALSVFAWRNKLHLADVADRLVPAVPIGLFLGRIANFINGELVGRPTSPDFPLAMVFPHFDALPRHPSQLYEAALEGALLFIVLYLATRTRIRRYQPSGLFLFGYGLARFAVEYLRTPEITHTWLGITLTQGQLLCLPMLAAGLALLYLAHHNPSTPHAHPPRRRT